MNPSVDLLSNLITIDSYYSLPRRRLTKRWQIAIFMANENIRREIASRARRDQASLAQVAFQMQLPIELIVEIATHIEGADCISLDNGKEDFYSMLDRVRKAKQGIVENNLVLYKRPVSSFPSIYTDTSKASKMLLESLCAPVLQVHQESIAAPAIADSE